MTPILIIGASGYVGQAFVRALDSRNATFGTISGRSPDWQYEAMFDSLRPALVINCAAMTGRPNISECESKAHAAYDANTSLPGYIAELCHRSGIPFAHISTACLWQGGFLNGKHRDDLRGLTPNPPPNLFTGHDETDEPTFFASVYVKSKLAAEHLLSMYPNVWIWRIRLPFSNHDHPRNYLTKLLTYPRLYDNVNSLTCLTDAIPAMLQIAERDLPRGIYNVVNPGYVSTREITTILQPEHPKPFQFFASDEEFLAAPNAMAGSNCVVEPSRLAAAGITVPTVQAALRTAVANWIPSP
jgi:3,5-epimerase/4-reductase